MNGRDAPVNPVDLARAFSEQRDDAMNQAAAWKAKHDQLMRENQQLRDAMDGYGLSLKLLEEKLASYEQGKEANKDPSPEVNSDLAA